MFQEKTFEGASVLVTGGTSGIGAAIAAAYQAAGAQVTVTGTRASAAAYEADLSAYRYHRLNIEDKASIAALAGDIPKLDILINNGGVALASQGLSEWEPDLFDRAVNMHLNGVFRLSAVLVDRLSESRSASFSVEKEPGRRCGKKTFETGPLASQPPGSGITKVFCAAFFQKSGCFLWSVVCVFLNPDGLRGFAEIRADRQHAITAPADR